MNFERTSTLDTPTNVPDHVRRRVAHRVIEAGGDDVIDMLGLGDVA